MSAHVGILWSKLIKILNCLFARYFVEWTNVSAGLMFWLLHLFTHIVNEMRTCSLDTFYKAYWPVSKIVNKHSFLCFSVCVACGMHDICYLIRLINLPPFGCDFTLTAEQKGRYVFVFAPTTTPVVQRDTKSVCVCCWFDCHPSFPQWELNDAGFCWNMYCLRFDIAYNALGFEYLLIVSGIWFSNKNLHRIRAIRDVCIVLSHCPKASMTHFILLLSTFYELFGSWIICM